MGIFDGVYFASDLDGTLLDERTNGISEENIGAIKHFMAEGGLFGFATGRTTFELGAFNERIGANSLCITGNGATLYDAARGENALIEKIDDDIIPFFEYVEREFPFIMFEVVASDDIIYYYRPNESLKKHRSITNAEFREAEHFTKITLDWTKIALWAMPEDILRFAREADTSSLPDRYNFMHSFEYCCEISKKSADKGSGLELIMSRLRPAGVKCFCAMGDNENDVRMLRCADISFVPKNAVPSAVAAADHKLYNDCCHHAVKEAIELLEKILKGESK